MSDQNGRDSGGRSVDSDGGLSRRGLLQAGGATAVSVGLAGCGGDGGDDGGDSDTTQTTRTTTDELQDPVFTNAINAAPGNSHYNPYNQTKFAGGLVANLYDSLFSFNYQTGEWHERLGSDLSADGNVATLTMNEGFSWKDGTPVVATDLVKQLRLESYLEYPIWDQMESIEATGDYTMEIQGTEPLNPDIFIRTLNRSVQVKRGSVFDNQTVTVDGEETGAFLQRLQNASGEEERSSLLEELQTFRYAVDDDDPIANGPYVVSEVEETRWLLERNPEYPIETNIPNYERLHITGTNNIWQLSIAGRMDGRGIIPGSQEVKQKFPEWFHQIRIPVFDGLGPILLLDDDVWGKKAARQGLMFLTDREQVDLNVNPRHSAIQTITGMTDNMAQNYAPDLYDQLSDYYGINSKPDRAASKFREAGYQKENGQWVDSGGSQIELKWIGAPWPGPTGTAETLNQLGTDFGINVSVTTKEPPAFLEQRRNREDYDMAFNALIGGPHPFFYAQNAIRSQPAEFARVPQDEVRLPPVGDRDGSNRTLNINDLLTNLSQVQDREELEQWTREYIWFFNDFLPMFQLTNGTFPTFISDNEWNIPDLDDSVMYIQVPCQELFRETEGDSMQARIQGKYVGEE